MSSRTTRLLLILRTQVPLKPTSSIVPSPLASARAMASHVCKVDQSVIHDHNGRLKKQGGPDEIRSKYPQNLHRLPLLIHSSTPPTGFFKDGYCDYAEEDEEKQLVAATLTPEFLAFTKENNLAIGGGLEGGELEEVMNFRCKWCISVETWVQAFRQYQMGWIEKEVVPLVDPEATHYKALGLMGWEGIKAFSVKREKEEEK